MFKISEFSKIAQVSRRLLQYYDEIDLFKPAYTDPHTGYRYYTAAQLPDITRILALKDLGLALEQVRRLVHDQVSADEIRGMLLLKQAQIEQTVFDELKRLHNVKLRLEQLEQGATEYNIVLKAVPPQPFMSIRRQLTSDEAMADFFFGVFESVRRYPFVAVSHHADFEHDQHDLEVGVVVEPSEKAVTVPETLTLGELSGVDMMASLVFQGVAGPVLYQALGTWIEAHDYELNGADREVFWNLGWPEHPEQNIVEIQLPVKRRKS